MAILNQINLTDREREVAANIAKGLTNPEIAEKLFVKRGTVKVHLTNILRKTGLRNRTELAGWWRDR